MTFYTDQGRLIVETGDDEGFIWSGGVWKEATPEYMRELWLERQPITLEQAKKAFPDADFVELENIK